jgi:hypothetical protein
MIFILTFYIIFLLLIAVYSFFAIYHLNRFGYVGDLTKPVIIFYLIIVAIIVIVTFTFMFIRY